MWSVVSRARQPMLVVISKDVVSLYWGSERIGRWQTEQPLTAAEIELVRMGRAHQV